MRPKYPLGAAMEPRSRTYRLASYLRGLGWAVAAVAVVAGVLALVQAFFHPFDLVLDKADASLAAMDMALTSEQFAGVSIGSLALVAAVSAIPMLKRGVRRRQYVVSFWRGLLSSAIFLGSDKLYRYVQGLGMLYFSATIALFVAVTIILVEIISRLGRLEDEDDTRTELVASIVSGLVFGLVIQVGEYGLRVIVR